MKCTPDWKERLAAYPGVNTPRDWERLSFPTQRKLLLCLQEITEIYDVLCSVRVALCRSEVVSLLGYSNQVRVFHVDYGSYESISLFHITTLPTHALQPTRQAVKCCLSDATCLTSEGLETLKALSLEKELEGKLQWSYDLICYYVTLIQQSGKSSIGELLISQGMATPLVRCNVLEPGLEVGVCH